MSDEIKTLSKVERDHIEYVLRHFNGNKVRAAKALDISVKTLYNKIYYYEIKVEKLDYIPTVQPSLHSILEIPE